MKRLCTVDGDFSPNLAFALADIIKEEAEILKLREEAEKSKIKFKSALGLYKRALSERDAALPIGIMNKIQGLESKIGAAK